MDDVTVFNLRPHLHDDDFPFAKGLVEDATVHLIVVWWAAYFKFAAAESIMRRTSESSLPYPDSP